MTLRVLHTHSCSLERFFHTASISTSAFPHSLDLYERFSTQPRFARLLRTASRPLLSGTLSELRRALFLVKSFTSAFSHSLDLYERFSTQPRSLRALLHTASLRTSAPDRVPPSSVVRHPLSSLQPILATSPTLFWARSICSPPIGRGHAPLPRLSLPWNRQIREMQMMDNYRTAICTDMSSRANGGRFGGTSRRATPRLHPSRGECRHTVLVGWRVPLMVCVGEGASSRA